MQLCGLAAAVCVGETNEHTCIICTKHITLQYNSTPSSLGYYTYGSKTTANRNVAREARGNFEVSIGFGVILTTMKLDST